jgi:hypothetical protein
MGATAAGVGWWCWLVVLVGGVWQIAARYVGDVGWMCCKKTTGLTVK